MGLLQAARHRRTAIFGVFVLSVLFLAVCTSNHFQINELKIRLVAKACEAAQPCYKRIPTPLPPDFARIERIPLKAPIVRNVKLSPMRDVQPVATWEAGRFVVQIDLLAMSRLTLQTFAPPTRRSPHKSAGGSRWHLWVALRRETLFRQVHRATQFHCPASAYPTFNRPASFTRLYALVDTIPPIAGKRGRPLSKPRSSGRPGLRSRQMPPLARRSR